MPESPRRCTLILVLVAAIGCASDGGSSSGALLLDANAVDAGAADFSGAVGGPLKVQLQDGRLIFSWDEDEFLYHCLKIVQDTGKAEDDFVYLCPPVKGRTSVVLGAKSGESGVDFAWSGVAAFQIGKATWALSGGQTLDFTDMTPISDGPMRIGPRFSGPCAAGGVPVDGLVEWSDGAPVTMNMSFKLPTAARNEVWFNTPEIIPDSVAATGGTSPGSTLSFSYTFDLPGLYTVEINNSGGGAIINCGVYVGADVPLVNVKVAQGGGLTTSPSAEKLAAMRKELLDLVNAERASVGRSALTLDETLNTVAQYHSENMAAKGFFGHTDPAGMGPGERAKKFGFNGPVGENLAKSYSVAGAHSGLFWSAGHRANMLGEKWGRVGFGMAKDGKGKSILVTENFSTAP